MYERPVTNTDPSKLSACPIFNRIKLYYSDKFTIFIPNLPNIPV
jgi:hypothetical protein